MSVKPRYARDEAKDAARTLLRGVITAPTLPIDPRGEIDEEGFRRDLRHIIDVLRTGGLYINGYYGHFWLMTSEQRRRAIEIAVDETAGAVPIICRVAHSSPGEAAALAQHAEQLGVDFLSLLTPQFGDANRETLLGYFRAIADATNLGLTVFNSPQQGYLLGPDRLAEVAEIPNVCALKNAAPLAHTIAVRDRVGDSIVVVDPDEENFLINLTQFGQKAIYTGANTMFDSDAGTPTHDYVAAALLGDYAEAARIFYGMQPVRALHDKWIIDPWRKTGLMPIAAIKYWQSLLGMAGGPVPPGLEPFSADDQANLRAELVDLGVFDLKA